MQGNCSKEENHNKKAEPLPEANSLSNKRQASRPLVYSSLAFAAVFLSSLTHVPFSPFREQLLTFLTAPWLAFSSRLPWPPPGLLAFRIVLLGEHRTERCQSREQTGRQPFQLFSATWLTCKKIKGSRERENFLHKSKSA